MLFLAMYLQQRVTRDSFVVFLFHQQFPTCTELKNSQLNHNNNINENTKHQIISRRESVYRLLPFEEVCWLFCCCSLFFVFCIFFCFKSQLFHVLFFLKNKTEQNHKSKPQNPQMERRMLYNHFKARTE